MATDSGSVSLTAKSCHRWPSRAWTGVSMGKAARPMADLARSAATLSDRGAACVPRLAMPRFKDDISEGETRIMKELHMPPAHRSQREDHRRSQREHDRQREESKPTEAPDVETRRPEDRWTDPMNVQHPTGRGNS